MGSCGLFEIYNIILLRARIKTEVNMQNVFKVLILVFTLCSLSLSTFAQSPTSFHLIRKGHANFYSATNGGFETITNIPINSLRCLKCHPGKLADNTPIDTATYQPTCNDCHNFALGNSVPDSICNRCHSRQVSEKAFYTDKHRTAGMTCVTCHIKDEMHADATPYFSPFDTIQGKTCQTVGCHSTLPVTSNDSLAHLIHTSKLECASCHARSEINCYNCHFETEVWQGMRGFKRPIGKLKGFIMLGRLTKTGKIGIVNYQSIIYQGTKSFVAYGPYYPHTIMPRDSTRACTGCHDNAVITEYNNTHQIYVAKWDSTSTPKTIVHKQGVIPIPPDYQTSLIYDFANYTGRVDTTYTNPASWVYAKTGLTGQQLLGMYVLPLTAAQMTKLGSTIGIKPINTNIPQQFELFQNYPNPFNPVTKIKFDIKKATIVTLNVYDISGKLITSILSNTNLNSGTYELDFSGTKLSSGIYFYKLETPEYNKTMKMILMK